MGLVNLNAQDITHPASGTSNFTVTEGTSVMYYDNGGAACAGEGGSYSNNVNSTAVICPSAAGSTISIEFLDLDVETRGTTNPCWDFIRVYDGDNTSNLLFEGCGEDGFADCSSLAGDGSDAFGEEAGSNDINGTNTGNAANNVFTSTAGNGCLTVGFESDSSVPQGGWVAMVSASSVGGGGGGATCTDGIQNGDETGVDCGGSSCAPCATCDDGIQNGDETGVDCGGSCAPCVVTCSSFDLTLNFDNFAGETSWSLETLSGTLEASVPTGTYSGQNNQTAVESFCLDPGCYELTIFDSFGDGMCCGFGQGSYTLSDAAGMTVASGGAFNDEDASVFCVAGPECVAPTASATILPNCSTGQFYVQVNLGSLGSATTVSIINDGGVPPLQNVFFPRRYFVGPFSAGQEVNILIGDTSTGCVTTLSGLTSGCGSTLASNGDLIGESSLDQEISVFPNPTVGDVNVSLGSVMGQAAHIRVLNAVGQLIEERQIDAVENVLERFDLSNQQAGMYFIHVDVEGGESHVERVILGAARP